MEVCPEKVGNENQNACRLKEHADRHDEIKGVPTAPRLVGVDSARHSEKAGNVHEIERQMESDEEEPEMEFTERLVVHLSGHLRKPIIEGAKSREKNAAYDDVMKVGDDEVGIPKLPIEGCRAQHDPGETGDQELKEKGDGEQHRCLEMNLSTPHGRQPVEDLDTRGNSDSHRRENKKRVCVGVHPDGEHVVGPHTHSDERNADCCGHHYGVTENRLAGKNRDDLGSKSERGNNQHIDFWMAENPEEVHPNYGGASGLRVEEMPAEVTVDKQHDLRRGKRANGKYHQHRHNQIEPSQQRHFPQRHSRAAHASDRGDNIDRRADAAEPRNEQGQYPEIGAVPARECLRSQGRVGKPSDVRSASGPVQAISAEEAEIKKNASEGRQPETESIEAREGHVSRTDH